MCAWIRSRAVLYDVSMTSDRRWRPRYRHLLLLAGAALVACAVAAVAAPLAGEWQRARQDQQARDEWRGDGSAAVVGAVPGDIGIGTPGAGPPTASVGCRPGTRSGELVTFTSLSRYGYAAVAADGTWDRLHNRSMVHYATSAAPGAVGNDVIAFHREPSFQHIDQLGLGDIVTIQDGNCRSWQYRVTDKVDVAPDAVTMLGPTTGHNLTLVTCTPWYRDTHRFVWRAALVS